MKMKQLPKTTTGGNPRTSHSRAGGNPASRHSRAGGNPVRPKLDSRLRGNDGGIAALDAESAEVLQTIIPSESSVPVNSPPRLSRAGGNPARPKLDSRLRGNDGMIAALDAESAEVLQTIRGLI